LPLAPPADASEWPRPLLTDDLTRDLYDRIKEIAATDANVRIWGGPGVGKKTWAHEIHRLSERKNGPFFDRHLYATPETLMAAVLFGSVASASTPDSLVGPGVLESATGGTVTLYGLEDLPIPEQSLLAQALDERKVRRVGETVPRAIDVRVIAISLTDPQSEKDSGRLRGDLYARLGDVTLKVPSLRERPKAIPILAQQFLKEVCPLYGRPEGLTFSADTLDRMSRRGWPGGVRELLHLVHMAVVRGEGDQLMVEQFEES
jgi:two-component system, NtrC family, response regulator AtoC